MARSDGALRRVRRAYEGAHAAAAARSLVIVALMIVLAVGLHRVTDATYFIATTFAITMASFAWRGGAWRRGALAGVVAGLPPLVVPAIVMLASPAMQCAGCDHSPTMPCMIACFGTGSLVGILVGFRAMSDGAPRRFALAAIATASLGGLLGCGTTGLGGAVGVVVGLVAGVVTGWMVAGRTAHTG